MSHRNSLWAPCVPALREAVKVWAAGGYKGITDTTRILLNYWFRANDKLPTGQPFRYHRSQQEAIETLVFVWEFEKVRTRKGLLQRYATDLHDVALPPYDDFARYCIKMATGSGETGMISLAIAWQYLNAVREQGRGCQGLREDVSADCTPTSSCSKGLSRTSRKA